MRKLRAYDNDICSRHGCYGAQLLIIGTISC
nr:MAG TPA: hypothetical protein [Caudoviricetes sp.]